MTEKPSTRLVRISGIAELPRIRKKIEDLDTLADDIRKNGLINPITVMDCGDGSYQLIAGQRRLRAMMRLCEQTIRATVLGPIDAQRALELEYAENEQRQQFTVSERLSFAEKLKVVEQAKARERMSTFAREGRHADEDEGVIARTHPEKGKSRDIIAKQVGLGSGSQLDRAMAVAEQRPDLLEKIDSGETTIFGAYQTLTGRSAAPAMPDDRPVVPPPVIPAFDEDASDGTCVPLPPTTEQDAFEEEPQARFNQTVLECQRLQGIIAALRAENMELRRRLGISATEPITITESNTI